MDNGVVGLDEGISQAVKTKNLLTTLLDSSSVKPLWLAQTLPILYLQIVAVYANSALILRVASCAQVRLAIVPLKSCVVGAFIRRQ
jgi:hypothetical protein